jgi:hypothetical protein
MEGVFPKKNGLEALENDADLAESARGEGWDNTHALLDPSPIPFCVGFDPDLRPDERANRKLTHAQIFATWIERLAGER